MSSRRAELVRHRRTRSVRPGRTQCGRRETRRWLAVGSRCGSPGLAEPEKGVLAEGRARSASGSHRGLEQPGVDEFGERDTVGVAVLSAAEEGPVALRAPVLEL